MSKRRTWIVVAAVRPRRRRLGVGAGAARRRSPEAVGLSSARVDRLKAVVQDYVNRNQIAGVTVVIARGGKVAVFEPIGRMDVEKNVPLKKDTHLPDGVDEQGA